ncbi:MAG TPA: HD domain-containing phosphohydrolase [Thermoleophilaceae bacterium]|nr:HD domain-containing phosphohydrolase [Thermoleophilaceae bacterium]
MQGFVLPSGYAPTVLQRMCHHVCHVLAAESAAVFVRSRTNPGELIAVAASGIGEDLIGERIHADRGATGHAVLSGAPVYIHRDDRLDWGIEHPAMRRWKAAAAAPVTFSGAVNGAMMVGIGDGAQRLGLRELELLGQLTGLVGRAIEQRELRALGSGDPSAEIAALLSAIEQVDEDTARHSDHVSRLALRVGRTLGMDGLDLLELELAARLHDIGKIRVPTEILAKPGPLTPTELELVRLHSLWGAEMIAGIAGLEAVALIVRFHHERFDGDGYPDGLAGERIPLASRIITACDAFHAMTSDRPYRRALPYPRATRELRTGSGSQFDPMVVKVLVRPSVADDLDQEPLAPAAVELGVEHLLPGP